MRRSVLRGDAAHLQPYAPQSAIVCIPACNRILASMQPYSAHAARLWHEAVREEVLPAALGDAPPVVDEDLLSGGEVTLLPGEQRHLPRRGRPRPLVRAAGLEGRTGGAQQKGIVAQTNTHYVLLAAH